MFSFLKNLFNKHIIFVDNTGVFKISVNKYLAHTDEKIIVKQVSELPNSKMNTSIIIINDDGSRLYARRTTSFMLNGEWEFFMPNNDVTIVPIINRKI